MDKGNTKKEKKDKNKKRNREAVEFVLANRDVDDPNYNNPDVNKKILLQVNKDEDLTEEQRKIINSIPKIQRGIFDEEAKLKRLLKQEVKEEKDNNDDNKNKDKDKKGVKFDFDKNEVVNFDKKKKVSEIENDKFLNDLKNNKIDLTKIEDEEKVNEIFKKLKVNAKMVEYNEFGLKKDTDPELLKFVTNKEFVEGVDIFVPAPRDNNDKIIKEYDTDMKEENMNEEFKELENELKSDSENENNNNNKINENNKNNEKKCEDINTSSKKEDKKEETKDKNDIEITGDLEDDFVLLANGGELPIEFLTEKEIKEEEKKKEELNKINLMGQENNKPSYKYITPEEVEYVRKKFLEGDDDKKKSQKKGNFISKQEFNDAINEILNSKKGKNGNKKETVMGLKKSVLDEDEYEEYELTEEEEEINDDIKKKEDKKEEEKEVKKNDEKKNKIKDIISFDKKKKEDEEEEDEDEEEEEDDDEGYIPNIKIEYVSKKDEPDPFDKEKEKKKRKQRNKKEMKKSKTKQYEQLKAMGELSDESFDREQLNDLIHEDELVEKTKEMIENNNEIEKDNKEVEQEIDKNYVFEPKVHKDITQTNDKVVNLPKAVKEERREKENRKSKKNEKEEDNEESKKEDNNQNMNVNRNSRRNETKEEKKLRQKLVKMEKKEKRAEKKKLKNAFKEEKISQQKQIAQANKIVRYGLSIKDI